MIKLKLSQSNTIKKELNNLQDKENSLTKEEDKDLKSKTVETLPQKKKNMLIAEQMLSNVEKLSFSNIKSFKSRITKFDGKIVECDSFPHLLVLYANYTVITVHLLQEKLLDLEKKKILLLSMIKMQI